MFLQQRGIQHQTHQLIWFREVEFVLRPSSGCVLIVTIPSRNSVHRKGLPFELRTFQIWSNFRQPVGQPVANRSQVQLVFGQLTIPVNVGGVICVHTIVA